MGIKNQYISKDRFIPPGYIHGLNGPNDIFTLPDKLLFNKYSSFINIYALGPSVHIKNESRFLQLAKDCVANKEPILENNIKMARKLACLTQTELSRVSGISSGTISVLENGGQVGVDTVIKLLQACNAPALLYMTTRDECYKLNCLNTVDGINEFHNLITSVMGNLLKISGHVNENV